MFISKDIIYVGVNDKKIDLFEGQFKVPNGMSYNSYVISDEKIAVLDTVDAHFGKEWLENVSAVLCGRAPPISWFTTWSPIIPPASKVFWKPTLLPSWYLPPKRF